MEMHRLLRHAAPFGMKNPTPTSRCAAPGACRGRRKVGSEHLKLTLSSGPRGWRRSASEWPTGSGARAPARSRRRRVQAGGEPLERSHLAAGASRGPAAAGVRIVAGEWGGRRLQAPPGRDTRPTTDRVREAWMSALAADLDGARVLDLFAGSGALGLEALSRGAAHATFVENAARPRSACSAPTSRRSAPRRAREIVRGTRSASPSGLAEADAFDIAFADPPYGPGSRDELVRALAGAPFARILSVEHGRGDPCPRCRARGSALRRHRILTFSHAG
jgi:16S rRNA (guanine966-N2)-methyltransferase